MPVIEELDESFFNPEILNIKKNLNGDISVIYKEGTFQEPFELGTPLPFLDLKGHLNSHLPSKEFIALELLNMEKVENIEHYAGNAYEKANLHKNRYFNIVPFNHSRVSLTGLDNNIYNLYLNAPIGNGCISPNSRKRNSPTNLNGSVPKHTPTYCHGTKIPSHANEVPFSNDYIKPNIVFSYSNESPVSDDRIKNHPIVSHANESPESDDRIIHTPIVSHANEVPVSPDFIKNTPIYSHTFKVPVSDDHINPTPSFSYSNEVLVSLDSITPTPIFSYCNEFPVSNDCIKNNSINSSHGNTGIDAAIPIPDDFIKTTPIFSYSNEFPVVNDCTKPNAITASHSDDYINASFISKCFSGSSEKYIAAQAPMPNTFYEFWKMIFGSQCQVVVMLSQETENALVKADRYWPDLGTPLIFNNLKITCTKKTNFPDCDLIIREFTIYYWFPASFQMTDLAKKSSPLSLKVTHFQYIGWPDHGVPQKKSGILSLVNRVNTVKKQAKYKNGPILVHCSAGVGRTGAFITIHCIYNYMQKLVVEQLKKKTPTETSCSLKKKTLNIFNIVHTLRSQRVGMVQQYDQYLFCYAVIHEEAQSLGLTSSD